MGKRIKKLLIRIFLSCLVWFWLALTSFGQQWSEPVNISNSIGLDNVPSILVDNTGTIHCVWEHRISSDYSQIFYSKSDDDGDTWSVGMNISLNQEKWLLYPHISSDSINNLYLTYDFDVYNSNQTMIVLKKFSGNSWSDTIHVSSTMPGSRKNNLVVDNNGRVYCFWLYGTNVFYRYMENDSWSEIYCPYPGPHALSIVPVCDKHNNIQCIGSYYDYGQTSNQARIVYFWYDSQLDIWSPLEEISGVTSATPDKDIDIDSNNNPSITWRQHTPGSGPNNDSTIYMRNDGMMWLPPETIVSDPIEQKIIIDKNNCPNVFDVEKSDSGSILIQYKKHNTTWVGFIIDESSYNIMQPSVTYNDLSLYVAYLKPQNNDEEIYFSKSYIVNSINDIPIVNLKLTPNPFSEAITISFRIHKKQYIDVSIFNMQGKSIYHLYQGEHKSGGMNLIWSGVGFDHKKVEKGVYILKIEIDNIVISKLLVSL